MNKNFIKMFKNNIIAKKIISKIFNISKKKIKIMEVCGSHTVAIFKNGIKSVLPKTISLSSGPGCPICVTSQTEIDYFIELSKNKNIIITTFGDLIRVPGSYSTLRKQQTKGSNIKIVYSTFDALKIAEKNPKKTIVFLGIGFETTAPTVAAAILEAEKKKINNFCIISSHKIVPPALETLVSSKKIDIDGFILPGHVSSIIGTNAYANFFKKNNIPCVVAGFENIDILKSILSLIENIESKNYKLLNEYSRAVSKQGNRKALKIMYEVFKIGDAEWRGLGSIKNSGLHIKKKYKKFDAKSIFKIKYKKYKIPTECICGEILTGTKKPLECKLYKIKCNPISPIGPCMVASEGTCAAYYNYNFSN